MKTQWIKNNSSMLLKMTGFARLTFLGILLSSILGSNVLAQQVETSINCDEGVITEPIAMAYGDSTVGCEIDPATEVDRFTFVGTAGDLVRINGFSTTANLDPMIEVRNTVGVVVASDSCPNFGCTFSLEFTVATTGIHLLTISDDGNNETGGYQLHLEHLLPAPQTDRLDFDSSVTDTIAPAGDIDQYYFNGTAGTLIRLLAFSTSNNMDPTIELRDPTGTIILNGAADGAQCNNFGCTFSVSVIPTLTGVYTFIIYDGLANETGDYELGLWCIFGPCDSNGSAPPNPDPAPPIITYDTDVTDLISPATDSDRYTFDAQAGTTIRLNVFSTTTNMDPTIELRDPSGIVILDGTQCPNFGCTFSVDFTAVVSGTYTLLIYDSGGNEEGSYQLSLWCLEGDCDNNGDATPGPVLSYVTTRSDTLSSGTDGDFFKFNGTAGTSIRVNAFSNSANMDPTIEIRDPNGNLIIDGAADGAQCNNFGCTFSVDFTPGVSGTYTLLFYDLFTNEAGNYQLSLWCLLGDCDTDGDGLLDNDRAILNYGDTVMTAINPALDGDYYLYRGTVGDQIRINAFSSSTNLDPTIEIRDPTGSVIINGAADGAQCSNLGCSFSIDLSPAVDGTHTLAIYDGATNEGGNYELSLECIFGTGPNFACLDLTPPVACGDNCIDVRNPGQIDANGDGFGNHCDADLDDNGIINFADLSILANVFLSNDAEADLNVDGTVNFPDVSLLASRFQQGPGPSCSTPNSP